MPANKQEPSLTDIALLFAPIWGPVLVAPIFMLLPSLLEPLGLLVFFVGLVAFPALGLRGLFRTSSAGPILKLVIGSFYFFPAMLFYGVASWGVCGVLLDSCKP